MTNKKSIHYKWKVIKNASISSAYLVSLLKIQDSVIQLMTLLWEVLNLHMFSRVRKLMKKDQIEVNYIAF